MYPKINLDKYTIFGKKGCLYCKKSKDFLDERNIEYEYIDCTFFLINKPQFLNYINSITENDWKTFPIIFNKETFIGGFAELKKYHNVE